jgi:hypothetical protein
MSKTLTPEFRVINKVLKKSLMKMGIHNTFRVSWYNFNLNKNLIIYVKGDVNKVLMGTIVKKIINDVLPLIFDKKTYVSSVSIRVLI